MNSYLKKIEDMNFDELRDELSVSTGNPVKELLIRKIMKQKYYEYKKKKQQKIANKKRKEMERIQSKRNKILKKKLADDLLNDIEFKKYQSIRKHQEDILDLVNDFDDNDFDETDFNDIPDHGPLNDLDPEARRYDNKFVKEIERDHMNNHLMGRLNSDIYIKDMGKEVGRTFQTPFSENPDENHASFHQDSSIIPNKDFSSKRLYQK